MRQPEADASHRRWTARRRGRGAAELDDWIGTFSRGMGGGNGISPRWLGTICPEEAIGRRIVVWHVERSPRGRGGCWKEEEGRDAREWRGAIGRLPCAAHLLLIPSAPNELYSLRRPSVARFHSASNSLPWLSRRSVRLRCAKVFTAGCCIVGGDDAHSSC